MSNIIKHQSQPTNNTCVCTCIAMLANLPVNVVIDRFHKDFYIGEVTTNGTERIEMKDILDALDLKYTHVLSGGNNRLLSGAIYMLTVPSLNARGIFHEIVVDYRDDAMPIVLDPAKGFSGTSLYYTFDECECDDVDQAVMLVSWVIDFILGDV